MLSRQAMPLRWTSAVLCLLAASAAVTGAVDCYCSNIEGCVNNTCSGNECGVELQLFEGQYRLRHRCFTDFFICYDDAPHSCCRGHYCNRCLIPTINLDKLPEEINLLSLLPSECLDSIPTPMTMPTTPPTSTDSVEPGPVTSTGTVTTSTDVSEMPPGGVMLSLPAWLYAIIFLGILVIFLCILCLIVVCWVSHRGRRNRCEVDSIGSLSISEMDSFPEECTLSNNSGGLRHCRFLEPRTIGQQVSFKERLARGGFGEVWRGDLNGEPVAVKVMSSLLEDCWKDEQDIYLTNMLHHENILRFIAVDNKIIDFSQKLIIIVEYHPHGSLYDYLSTHVISSQQLLRMMSSVINGVSFLHMPVTSTFKKREKPAIAHRDIKTKNILVKRDGSCCIADFGLSVRSDNYKKKSLDPIKGTKRYMAPEILSRTINSGDFQSFVKVDIYAFGLVLWETTRRCGDVGEVGEYQVPYQNCVPNDPSIEDMKKIVVTEGLRPDLEERWKTSEVTSTMSSIMQECWRANPLSRLSAFRIKKKLQALSSDVKESLPPPPLKPDTQF